MNSGMLRRLQQAQPERELFRSLSYTTPCRSQAQPERSFNNNTVRPEQGTEPVEGPRRRVGGMRTRLRQAQPERSFNNNTVRPEQGTEPVEGPRRRVGGMRARLRQAQPERSFSSPILRYPRTTLRYLRASGFVLS